MNDVLIDLGLTTAQKDFRKRIIGGSDANILMSGNDERILQLWKEKRGEAESEDLSDVLQVQLGSWTEAFNRSWFTKKTKRTVTNGGDQMICLDYPFMGCTLDGLTDNKTVLWEAKHVSAFAKDEEVLEKYFPQLTHNMIVCGLAAATLSVIFGNHRYEVFDIMMDEDYAAQLIEVERNFWDCVQNNIQPVIVGQKYTGPIDRKVDMTGNNEWASAVGDYLANQKAAKVFEEAKADLKALVPVDAVEAFGHGITAKRSKTGSLTIKESK
jgi:predicted phage-related endonuclease